MSYLVRNGSVALVLALSVPLFAHAAPPASPYEPGETIAPDCAPGSTNCTVRPFAASGANRDITSLSGLTTPLSPIEGGTGISSYVVGDLIYATGPYILARLGAGALGGVLSLAGGTPAWTATSTLGLVTDDLTEGVNKFFTDARADARISATSTVGTLTALPNLSAIGTIASGVWHGSPIDAALYLANFGVPFYSYFHATTSDALPEGAAHPFYSDARVGSYVSASSTIPHAAGLLGNLLAWNGSAWASRATSTLGIDLSDTRGLLTASQGGTGLTNIPAGSILTGNGTGPLAPLALGASGQTLAVVNGAPTWVATTTFSSGLTYANGVVGIANGAISNAQLSNASITLTAGSGLTGGSSIPLGGSGGLSIDFARSNSWSGLQQFLSAAVGSLSVFTSASFGGTATSSFGANGDLTLAGVGTNMLLASNGSGKVVASSTPTVAAIVGTSTSATSTFAGGFAVGANKLVVDRATGNVGVGTAAPSNALSVVGKISSSLGFIGTCFSGSLVGLLTLTCNQDVAESYAASEPTEAGDVVGVPAGGSGAVGKVRSPEDAVLGVVSTNPGLVFKEGKTYLAGENDKWISSSSTVVALTGRVPVKVSLENGPISAGDELSASLEHPGFAARSTGPGMVIGVALQPYSSPEDSLYPDGDPRILLFANRYWSPGAASSTSPTLGGFASAVIGALAKLGVSVHDGILTLKEVIADKLTTHVLCLDDVCIDKAQLQELLRKNQIEDGVTGPLAPQSPQPPESSGESEASVPEPVPPNDADAGELDPQPDPMPADPQPPAPEPAPDAPPPAP